MHLSELDPTLISTPMWTHLQAYSHGHDLPWQLPPSQKPIIWMSDKHYHILSILMHATNYIVFMIICWFTNNMNKLNTLSSIWSVLYGTSPLTLAFLIRKQISSAHLDTKSQRYIVHLDKKIKTFISLYYLRQEIDSLYNLNIM